MNTTSEAESLYRSAQAIKEKNGFDYIKLLRKSTELGSPKAFLEMGQPESCKTDYTIFTDVKIKS